MIEDIVNFLSALSLAQWVLLVVYSIGVVLIRELVFRRWLFRRERNLHRNLKRPVILLRPTSADGSIMPGGDMTRELDLLKGSGFLNIPETPADHRTFDPSGGHCIVVLGYKQGMDGLIDVLNKVKTHHVPLIVYTFGNNQVSGADKEALASYPYTLYANFPLTLLNQIFSTVASYPYERK